MNEHQKEVLDQYHTFLSELVNRYEYKDGLDYVAIANEYRSIAEPEAVIICDRERDILIKANCEIMVKHFQDYLLTKLNFDPNS